MIHHDTGPRYLTKSRFKLAVECPTKLFYTGKPELYGDATQGDEFLRALADGGFQVGELAKVMFPGGLEVRGATHQDQVDETRRLMERDTVTLFEAAIVHHGLFARVDVLRKEGRQLELIEVKAKSFDSSDPNAFRGKRGALTSNMLPYLRDVAFQQHVLRQAYPDLEVRTFLMLADKTARCSVGGLHQRFRIHRQDGRSVVRTLPGTDATTIGTPILACVNVDEYVEEILQAPLEVPGAKGRLADLAAEWADAYRSDVRLAPVIGAHCGGCEFRAGAGADGSRSGFHECWENAAKLSVEDIAKGTVLDLWNFRGKGSLIDRGVLKLHEVTREDLTLTAGNAGLSQSQRQWMQVSGEWPGGGEFFIDRALMKHEMAGWEFPLQFIDFEATRTAIPFFAGERPYSQIAFQFSLHVVEADGSVAHRAEFLGADPGVRPNYEFVRQLRNALCAVGTIFMWTPYENTTLNAILAELAVDTHPPGDAAGLRTFIEGLTTRKAGNTVVHTGARAMVDLARLASLAFFHPATHGSSSIKKVLPAVLRASVYLRQRYSHPVYGAVGAIPSHNFVDMAWWQDTGNGTPIDPYALLPPVFGDIPQNAIETLELDEHMRLAEGGAAMIAFGRLQYDDVPPDERAGIEAALRRYCELDTLAMVMIYEAWREWVTP